MYKYRIEFKEYDGDWSSTMYYSAEPVTKQYLIKFFGLHECEDYIITRVTEED